MKNFLARQISAIIHESFWYDYVMFCILVLAIWKYANLVFFYLGDQAFDMVVMMVNGFILAVIIRGWVNFLLLLERLFPKMREFIHTPLFRILEVLVAGYIGYKIPSTLAWLFDVEIANAWILLAIIPLGFIAGVGIGQICRNLRTKYPLE